MGDPSIEAATCPECQGPKNKPEDVVVNSFQAGDQTAEEWGPCIHPFHSGSASQQDERRYDVFVCAIHRCAVEVTKGGAWCSECRANCRHERVMTMPVQEHQEAMEEARRVSDAQIEAGARALYERLHPAGGWGSWIDEGDRLYHDHAGAVLRAASEGG